MHGGRRRCKAAQAAVEQPLRAELASSLVAKTRVRLAETALERGQRLERGELAATDREAQSVAPGVWGVLGSSTAAGVGAPAGEGWVARLSAAQRSAGVAVSNLAQSGLLTSQALPTGTAIAPGRLPPDPVVNIDRALLLAPRLVILAFPTNDAMAGIPAPETVGHWQLIRQHAAQAGAATLVLSTV